MDDHDYVNMEYHQAFHHYIKVISTHLNMDNSAADTMMAYQFLKQSQIVFYDEFSVPEARFSYDFSPMSIVVEKKDYLTSLCAIIGGTFMTFGLVYLFTVGIMLVLYLRRRSDRQANVRMKLLILKAIYSKPELEAAAEKELREFI